MCLHIHHGLQVLIFLSNITPFVSPPTFHVRAHLVFLVTINHLPLTYDIQICVMYTVYMCNVCNAWIFYVWLEM
jgi:hypothetical protein